MFIKLLRLSAHGNEPDLDEAVNPAFYFNIAKTFTFLKTIKIKTDFTIIKL